MLSQIGKKKKLFLVFLMVFIIVVLIFYMLKKVLEKREEHEKQLKLEKEKGHAEHAIMEEQEEVQTHDILGKEHDMVVDMKQYKLYQEFSPECLWTRSLMDDINLTPLIAELAKTSKIIETEKTADTSLPQVEIFFCYQNFTKVFRVVIVSMRHLTCFKTNDSSRLRLQVLFSQSEEDTVMECSKLYELTDEIIMDEKFSFHVSQQDFTDKKLFLSIWSFDTFHQELLLGAVVVELDFLNSVSKETMIKDIIPVMQDSNTYGYILVSLCHVPSAERITCTVMSGKDLKTNLGKTSLLNNDLNTYVTISLINDGKLIKRYKTETILQTRDPLFNEAFYFFVPQKQLHLVDLLITVLHKGARGASTVIGKLLIGCHASADALHHWNMSMDKSGQSFAKWHALTK